MIKSILFSHYLGTLIPTLFINEDDYNSKYDTETKNTSKQIRNQNETKQKTTQKPSADVS